MSIDFGRALTALKKLKEIPVHSIMDLAFPDHTEARKLELEKLYEKMGNYTNFFVALEGDDASSFNDFLNLLVDGDVKELMESIKPEEITDTELQPPSPIQVTVEQENEDTIYSLTDSDGNLICTFSKELDDYICRSYANAIATMWNKTFSLFLTPDGVADIKYYASRELKWERLTPAGMPPIHYLQRGDNLYYFHTEQDYNTHHCIDLSAYSYNLKEKIAHNYGFTQDVARRGKRNINDTFGDGASLRMAIFIFLFFQSRRKKGAEINISVDQNSDQMTYQ